MKDSPITFCISTYNNLEYLKIAVESVRENSYYKDAPFIIHAENCDDGTDEWLEENREKYNIQFIVEKNKKPKGIGGGMNFCADLVETEFIMFLHSDFYVTKDWDKVLMEEFEKYPNKRMWVNSYRIEPDMFNLLPEGRDMFPIRTGTIVVSEEIFGAYYHDFDSDSFDEWVEQFKIDNVNAVFPKGEGVSGLIKKEHWDLVGGNDPLFAPASWEDMDLFLRMLNRDFEFRQPLQSIVWHFGARGSHRLEENDGKSSQRQLEAERRNQKKWIEKWGSLPKFDQYGMIEGLK